MRTDREIINAAKTVGIYNDAEWRRIVELAEVGLGKQPPPGAVQLQIAVVIGEEDEVWAIPCGDWDNLESPASAIRRAWRCVDFPTHAAIVKAWIPPRPEPAAAEVEGTSDSCPLCANSHADAR